MIIDKEISNLPIFQLKNLRRNKLPLPESNVKPIELVDLPIHGEVPAGSVVPFTAREGEMGTVALPPGVKKADAGLLLVCGPSLEEEDIYTGDLLIYTRRFDRKAIFEPDEIFIVDIKATGEYIAKKVIPHGKEMLILRASGGGVRDQFHHRDDVELIGLVMGFQRMWRNRDGSRRMMR